jgi:soluble lytic murein transglycosylase-like protein
MRRLIQLALFLTAASLAVPAAEFANLSNGFIIRHERHEVIGAITRLYFGKDGSAGYMDVASADVESFASAPGEANEPASSQTADLGSIIQSASSRTHIDADFLASVIRAESANNPLAVSRKGAQGLMQLMPSTAGTLGVRDSFDPADNVDGGARYLLQLLERYQGDAVKALAAYNAGPQRVDQYHGVPPYRETHAYVARIINDYNRKKLAQQKQRAQPSKKESASTPSGSVATIEHSPTIASRTDE